MWTITNLDLSAVPGAQAYMSDGLPVVGTARNGIGSSYRLMIAGLGYADFTEAGIEFHGPDSGILIINGSEFVWLGDATMAIAAAPSGGLTIVGSGNDQELSPMVWPFPPVNPNDIATMQAMVAQNLLPYPLLPGERPFSAVEPLAGQYFPFSPYAYYLGLSLYDWTTADFFRMDIWNYYRYTALPGQPLDDNDIVNAIWTSAWKPYVPSDPNFMNSMMMTPANTEQEVAAQYPNVAEPLYRMLDALKRVTTSALISMPRTSVVSKPLLYSGQVDVSNLGEDALPVYFREYPGNAGPAGSPMGMPLAQALSSFMAPGQIVTLKSFMSFTDTLDDAVHYSNGILVEMSPAARNVTWRQCAYVTPFSNEADKTEYLFCPDSQFVMGTSSQQIINGKSVTVIGMTEAPA